MGPNTTSIIRFIACFILGAGLICAVVYAIKYRIDNMGQSKVESDMNLEVSEKDEVTEASKTINTGLIDRLKFNGILIEKMDMDGKLESKLLEGKISEEMEKMESLEEKTREKQEKKRKTFKLEFIIVANMFGMVTLMVLTGVICVVLKRKKLLCWKEADEKNESYEMTERRNEIWV